MKCFALRSRRLLANCSLIACVALVASCSSTGGSDDVRSDNDAGSDAAADVVADTVTDVPKTDASKSDAKQSQELLRIEITPLNLLEELDINTSKTIEYKAKGVFRDYSEQDYSDKVTWTIEDESVGAFNGSTLTLSPRALAEARTTLITAKYEKITAHAQLTVVSLRKSGDKTDFFFVLPYQDKAGEQKKTLDFKTDVRALDVFFAMDTTISMQDAINNLKASVVNEIITPMSALIPDFHFGVGSFDDFPVGPYGSETNGKDQPFRLITAMTSTADDVLAGVGMLELHHGNDGPESMIEALYQISTGEGLDGPGATKVLANSDGIGGVAFRQGTMPVIVPITDAPSHTVGEAGSPTYCPYPEHPDVSSDYEGPVASVAHSRQQAKDALDKICGKIVGVATKTHWTDYPCDAEGFLTDFARHTGALIPPSAWGKDNRPVGCEEGKCCTGEHGKGRMPTSDGLCTLVFKADEHGNGLGASIISGLQMLTRFAAFDVLTRKEGLKEGRDGQALPEGKTTADFIQKIVAKDATKPSEPADLPDPIKSADRFRKVTPGTLVTFDVKAYNDFVEPTEKAQFFSAKIKVLAGGCTDLDEREVLILVPPKELSVIK